MTLTQNVDPYVYYGLTEQNRKDIDEYMKSPMTATVIKRQEGPGRSNEIITSEIIYYWMIKLGIPREYEKWHINRLMTLIEVCSIKDQPAKKMSQREIYSQNAALNAQRRGMSRMRGR